MTKGIEISTIRIRGHSFSAQSKSTLQHASLESRPARIKYENQKVVELTFQEHDVGEGCVYLIVSLPGGKMVVELKAVGGEMGASEEHERQFRFGIYQDTVILASW